MCHWHSLSSDTVNIWKYLMYVLGFTYRQEDFLQRARNDDSHPTGKNDKLKWNKSLRMLVCSVAKAVHWFTEQGGLISSTKWIRLIVAIMNAAWRIMNMSNVNKHACADSTRLSIRKWVICPNGISRHTDRSRAFGTSKKTCHQMSTWPRRLSQQVAIDQWTLSARHYWHLIWSSY